MIKALYHKEVVPKLNVLAILSEVVFDKPYISTAYARGGILDLWEKKLVTIEQSNPKELNNGDMVELTKEGMDICMLTDLRIE